MNRQPIIALVGRANVGKSTLFNRLTRTRSALVFDQPGVTRDRQYGEISFEADESGGQYSFLIIDTGGVAMDKDNGIDGSIDEAMLKQTQLAIAEADIVFFMVDGRAGCTAADDNIAQVLREQSKPVVLVVNKIDGVDIDVAKGDFYHFGFDFMLPITASHGRGVYQLLEKTSLAFGVNIDDESSESIMQEKTLLKGDEISVQQYIDSAEDKKGESNALIKLAVFGRPNVGKSTLINRILGEERVVVFDHAGTTRDSIYIPFERRGKQYTLIDTAGVRRRARVNECLEKFSIGKALQAIEHANVIILVLDAHNGLAEQDLKLLNFALESGRGIVLAVNKWDNLSSHQREEIRVDIERRLNFVPFLSLHFISAKFGTGVGNLFDSVHQAYDSATQAHSANQLTRLLLKAVQLHQPPIVQGHRIKLRFAHSGGHNPPRIVIHGNKTDQLPTHYQRYLEGFFQKELELSGTPIKFEFKTGDNPYADKKNKLTGRQIKRKKRLMSFVKNKRRT